MCVCTCFCSWVSWEVTPSILKRVCCSSSWAAPTKLLFLSAEWRAFSSYTYIAQEDMLYFFIHKNISTNTTGNGSVSKYVCRAGQFNGLTRCPWVYTDPHTKVFWRFSLWFFYYLGVVGLLNVLLVDAKLLFVLSTKFSQSFRQFTLKILLPATVDFHHTRLIPALRLTKLL